MEKFLSSSLSRKYRAKIESDQSLSIEVPVGNPSVSLEKDKKEVE